MLAGIGRAPVRLEILVVACLVDYPSIVPHINAGCRYERTANMRACMMKMPMPAYGLDWIGGSMYHAVLKSRAARLPNRNVRCHPVPGGASVVLPYSSTRSLPIPPEIMRGFGTTDVPFPLEALPSHTVDVVGRWRHQLED